MTAAARQTILLVEDNPITRRMVRFALESQGFQVVEAGGGNAALAAFPRHRISLVLQDLVLPDLDGFELVQRLRAFPGGAEVPMLAFSGLLSKIEEARISAVGFDDVIAKPVEPSRLLQIVRAHLPAPSSPDVLGAGRRLIVVDDDPVQRKLACFRLQKAGFAVTPAADGVEALELARKERPHAIVSDVLMPRLDGFGLCLSVRKDQALAATPVILVTNSYVESADRELARRAGANDMVLRTPELREVLTALQSTLAGAPSPPNPRPEEAGEELERDRMRRVMRQLERQVSLNAGASRRTALLAAELSVLSGISEALATQHDIEEAMRMVLAACFDAGGISVGALCLAGTPPTLIRFGADSRWRDEDLTALLADSSLLAPAIQSQSILVIPSDAVPEQLGKRLLERAGAASALLAPLAYKGEVLGVLLMASRTIELLADDRIVFAQTVAGQISQSLALARAFAAKDASERAARQQATMLESILESIADGVVVVDERGEVIVWNPAAEALIGEPPGRVAPDDWSAKFGMFRADRVTPLAAEEAPLVRAMRGESTDLGEIFLRQGRRPDGVWLDLSTRPLCDDDNGARRGGVAVFRDVTAAKAAQAQLMVSDRMASVGLLAAGVAHEINNPLAAVMANLELALRELEDIEPVLTDPALLTELKEELTDARDASHRVRQIVRDLRIFSRAEEDRHGPVEVRKVLESTLRMAWNEIRHRARLVKEFRETPLVDANESRLGQVFLNLIMNAAQAIPEGQADQNEIRVLTSVDPAGRVQIDIADTGAGMSPEVLARLFTPFFTTKPAGVGTGLGLMICQRLITAMGGEIAVDSEVGAGSRFRVALPALGGEEAAEAPAAPAAVSAPRRGRILVVDDEPMIGMAVARVLGSEHEVTHLTSAAEALELIRGGQRFAVIICDLMMPMMTGMDLHKELSHIAPGQAGRMLFLTGGAFTPQARAFLDQVANPRLEKPFDVVTLRSLVNERV